MSIYSTRYLTRDEAIKEIRQSQTAKELEDMTDGELEDLMFNLIGREDLPNSPLNNYIIRD